MNLKHLSRAQLLDYLQAQLSHLFPDRRPVRPLIERHADQALVRLGKCIDAVRMWRAGEFDYLHSTQYALFLYFLANTVWRAEGEAGNEDGLCSKLFFLNKALNGIDCFYEIELPEVFFIGHTVGIVLAKATYGQRLVLYQNSTVGKNHGVAPVLEDNVVMYPNTAVIGRCRVRQGSILAQGTSVINHDTPGNCLVFNGPNGQPAFKRASRDIIADIFR